MSVTVTVALGPSSPFSKWRVQKVYDAENWSVSNRGVVLSRCFFCADMTYFGIYPEEEGKGRGFTYCFSCLERWIGPVRRKIVEVLLTKELSQ